MFVWSSLHHQIQYRFATQWELFLLAIAVFFTILKSFVIPLDLIVYSEITSKFIERSHGQGTSSPTHLLQLFDGGRILWVFIHLIYIHSFNCLFDIGQMLLAKKISSKFSMIRWRTHRRKFLLWFSRLWRASFRLICSTTRRWNKSRESVRGCSNLWFNRTLDGMICQKERISLHTFQS